MTGTWDHGVSQHAPLRAPMAQLIIVETAPATLVRGASQISVMPPRKDDAAEPDSKPPMLRTAVVRGLSVSLGLMQRNRRSIARHPRAAAQLCCPPHGDQHVATQRLTRTAEERLRSSGASWLTPHKCLI